MVIEDNEILFAGYQLESGELCYFEFEYGVANIEYPNFSDYIEK